MKILKIRNPRYFYFFSQKTDAHLVIEPVTDLVVLVVGPDGCFQFLLPDAEKKREVPEGTARQTDDPTAPAHDVQPVLRLNVTPGVR